MYVHPPFCQGRPKHKTPLDCYIEKYIEQQGAEEQGNEEEVRKVRDRHKEKFNKLSETEKETYEEEASTSLQRYQEVPRYSSLRPLNAPIDAPIAPCSARSPQCFTLCASLYTAFCTRAASACPVYRSVPLSGGSSGWRNH